MDHAMADSVDAGDVPVSQHSRHLPDGRLDVVQPVHG
jgi:hypothetical protein